MEQITDFDQWFSNLTFPEIEYYAIFKEDTGEVIGIYPSHSAKNIKNKILVDQEFADSIINGHISMSSCFVDDSGESLEIIQTCSIQKIDDILHRIIDKKFATFNDPDISIIYTDNKLTFSLSHRIKNKKIKWDTNSELRFIVSEYNDPHKIIKVIGFTLKDLYNNDLTFECNLSKKQFSIFTSRIFKKYIFQNYEDS
jgi:hypothetical protein